MGAEVINLKVERMARQIEAVANFLSQRSDPDEREYAEACEVAADLIESGFARRSGLTQ